MADHTGRMPHVWRETDPNAEAMARMPDSMARVSPDGLIATSPHRPSWGFVGQKRRSSPPRWGPRELRQRPPARHSRNRGSMSPLSLLGSPSSHSQRIHGARPDPQAAHHPDQGETQCLSFPGVPTLSSPGAPLLSFPRSTPLVIPRTPMASVARHSEWEKTAPAPRGCAAVSPLP